MPIALLGRATAGHELVTSNGANVPAEVTGVFCGSCQEPLKDARPDDPVEGRAPCAHCGSLARLVKLYAHDAITFHEDLNLKKRRPGFRSGGKSRPAQEQWSGQVLSADGVWRERSRVVDREHDWYEERVVDPDGTVRHQQAHPLSDHTEHGSARRRG